MNSCPLPFTNTPCVTMAHGGGGRQTERLIREIFAPAFGMESGWLNDGVDPGGDGWVVTTDAHVVRPILFPGGDIGSLAANGTCNDLAVAGAEPKWLAVSWILEEGVPLEVVGRVAKSLAAAAAESGARVVAGDTKVIEKSKGDGIFLQSSGFGRRVAKVAPTPRNLAAGQVLVLSGDVARHGMAIQSARDGGLGFASEITSDCCALWPMIKAIYGAGIEPAAMRDCTRGGLATVLCEWAEESGQGMFVREAEVPVAEDVRAACEILGFDPLYIACEGRFLAAVSERDAAAVVAILQKFPVGKSARAIGRITEKNAGMAVAAQAYGTERVLDRLSGEILPRIC